LIQQGEPDRKEAEIRQINREAESKAAEKIKLSAFGQPFQKEFFYRLVTY